MQGMWVAMESAKLKRAATLSAVAAIGSLIIGAIPPLWWCRGDLTLIHLDYLIPRIAIAAAAVFVASTVSLIWNPARGFAAAWVLSIVVWIALLADSIKWIIHGAGFNTLGLDAPRPFLFWSAIFLPLFVVTASYVGWRGWRFLSLTRRVIVWVFALVFAVRFAEYHWMMDPYPYATNPYGVLGWLLLAFVLWPLLVAAHVLRSLLSVPSLNASGAT